MHFFFYPWVPCAPSVLDSNFGIEIAEVSIQIYVFLDLVNDNGDNIFMKSDKKNLWRTILLYCVWKKKSEELMMKGFLKRVISV
jgi:hypothetical protein